MKISIVGSGNVAWHLSKALSAAGHTILQITGRNQKAVTELTELVGAEANFSLQSIHPDSDLVLLCVKDDAIEPLALSIPSLPAIIAHTSGFRSKELLKGCGENYGILYPLQTMKKGIAISLKDVPFLIEGSNQDTEITLEKVAFDLSTSVHRVTELQRQYIHLAAVFANNFTNHLHELAEQILASQHVSLDLLRPLMAQSAENLQHFSPSQLQTGPAARSDFFTIEAHLKLLSSEAELCKVYTVITESILRQKLA
jgi:predicted short-subunit dehydrogenase-like oxidoreductase (DUF2520 family)